MPRGGGNCIQMLIDRAKDIVAKARLEEAIHAHRQLESIERELDAVESRLNDLVASLRADEFKAYCKATGSLPQQQQQQDHRPPWRADLESLISSSVLLHHARDSGSHAGQSPVTVEGSQESSTQPCGGRGPTKPAKSDHK